MAIEGVNTPRARFLPTNTACIHSQLVAEACGKNGSPQRHLFFIWIFMLLGMAHIVEPYACSMSAWIPLEVFYRCTYTIFTDQIKYVETKNNNHCIFERDFIECTISQRAHYLSTSSGMKYYVRYSRHASAKAGPQTIYGNRMIRCPSFQPSRQWVLSTQCPVICFSVCHKILNKIILDHILYLLRFFLPLSQFTIGFMWAIIIDFRPSSTGSAWWSPCGP